MADKPHSVMENCACEQCCETSCYTSRIGSQSCPSNYEKCKNIKQTTNLNYPTTVFVMRHSERVDDLFPGWTKHANVGGKYKPYDLNMPSELPIDRPLVDYSYDTPITRTGTVLAMMVGRGLMFSGHVPDVIYCSPALRCMQTAYNARLMSGSEVAIRVEPGLFENTNVYGGKPVLASPRQREKFGIDESYRPIFDFNEIFAQRETVVQYNARIRDVLLRLVAYPERSQLKKELNVLIVAHASSVDLSVGLLRQQPRITTDMHLIGIAKRVPYCSIVCLQRGSDGKSWEPVLGALPPVSYNMFTNKYDVDFLLRA